MRDKKTMTPFRILFFGDIVGAIGRTGVCRILPKLREEYAPDMVVANVENLAHGRGVTPKTMLELDAVGIDAYTSGNHVFENGAGLGCFSDPRWAERFIRPANLLAFRPGKGSTVVTVKGTRVRLINLLGQLFMRDEVESPFTSIEKLLADGTESDVILVDFHTETTSEKEALGHFVDGRVAGVFGTHTHVPTADMKILPGGTAYVTDIGRNGGMDTVVGFEKIAAVSRFLKKESKSYDPPDHGIVEINAVLLEIDLDTRKPLSLRRIQEKVDV